MFFKKCLSRKSVLISVMEVNLGFSGRGNTWFDDKILSN